MADDTTNIQISVEMWRWLSSQKTRPGDSFDDVLRELRGRLEELEELEDDQERLVDERDQEDVDDDRADDPGGLELEDDRAGDLDDVELDQELEDALEEWAAGYDRDDVESETAAREGRKAVEWLATREEPASKSEFQDALAASSRLSRRVWWEFAARPALNHLRDEELVEYHNGYKHYRLL